APVRKGARELELVRNREIIAAYSPNDVAQFRPIKPTEEPIVSEIEALVKVVAPVLEGESMWRFKYCSMALRGEVVDDEYLQRVRSREESFRSGDLLRVRLRTVQERVNGRITTRHFIVRVLDLGPDVSAA